MKFKILFFLLPLLLSSEEIEVRLKTAADLKPIYLTPVKTDPSQFDWRYFEDLRSVLAFDLNQGGFATVMSGREEWEKTIHYPDPKLDFDLSVWRREKIPYVLTITVMKNSLQITAFNIEKGTSKRYPEFTLTGRLETDRKPLHKLADQIHKDLFGVEGIASLRLIFSQRSQGSDRHSEIWISDSDGVNARQVTKETTDCLTPAFFPHTAGVANPTFFYVSYGQGQSKIYRSSLLAEKPTPVVELRGSQVLPALNQKGTQMAFIADAAGRPDLFIQSFDAAGMPLGKSRQLFTSPRATQASPTYSPDGKKIAFVSDKDGPPRIYQIDVLSPTDTKKVRPKLLTTRNRENTSPSWSPDGKKLAYSAKIDGVRQIWLYDFETEEEIALTTGPENKENPTWAPDSLHIVYNTDNEEDGELFLIDLNRKEPIQISKGTGQKRFPSFETR